MAHALAGAFAPERDGDALACRLQRKDVFGHRLEDVAARLGTFRREIVTLPAAGVDYAALLVRHREWREARERCGVQPFLPLGFREIETIGRQRPVWWTAVACGERLHACLIVVFD